MASGDESCAAAGDSPPRTAVCITGAARSFSAPLVQAGLRHNLIPSLGNVRLFLQLKSRDSDKAEGWFGQYSQHRENISNVETLLATLSRPWLARLIGEASVLGGNGSYLGEGAANSSIIRPVAPDGALHAEYRPSGACASQPKPRLLYRDRQLLLYLGMEWCRRAVLRHEAATGVAFESVAFARPDLVWWEPPTPWCRREPRRKGLVHAGALGSDQAWVVPRGQMNAFLSLAARLRDCKAERCCGPAESVLADVARSSDLAVEDHAARNSFTPQQGHLSLLRSVQGVCEAVLHPSYDGRRACAFERGALALPITTANALRRLFVENASTQVHLVPESTYLACRQALGATPCGARTPGLPPCGWGEKF